MRWLCGSLKAKRPKGAQSSPSPGPFLMPTSSPACTIFGMESDPRVRLWWQAANFGFSEPTLHAPERASLVSVRREVQDVFSYMLGYPHFIPFLALGTDAGDSDVFARAIIERHGEPPYL